MRNSPRGYVSAMLFPYGIPVCCETSDITDTIDDTKNPVDQSSIGFSFLNSYGFRLTTTPLGRTMARIVALCDNRNNLKHHSASVTCSSTCFWGRRNSRFCKSDHTTMTQQLPQSDQLDISALSRLFRNKTNSYKYLFFISLITLMKHRNFEVEDCILLDDIEIEMLVTAWYPHVYFKLSFGTQDRIASALQSVPPIDKKQRLLSSAGRDRLRNHLASTDEVHDYRFTRYVPNRILRPFFETEMYRETDHVVDREIPRLAAEHFYDRRPLFRFDNSRKRIFLHPYWIEYLKQHQAIIEGWALWHWADYMQGCNPGIPAVTRKLFPPDKRESLRKQREFWKDVIGETEIRCIYSGKKLSRVYDLDHFLPWRFVAHDQLWNLIPVDSRANSSKSDQIPSEIYIDRLAEIQSDALSIARDSMSDAKWKREVEPYSTDLYIKDVETLDREKLKSAYCRTLRPLMSIAEQQGFQSGWVYK